MSKNTRNWLIIGISLLLVGSAIFVGGMSVLKWDFSKLSTQKFVSNEYEVTEEYENIKIVSKDSKVELIASNNEQTKVVLYEREKSLHTVLVEENTLKIEINDERAWYDFVGFNFKTPSVKVYLPSEKYKDFSVDNKTGAIKIPSDFIFENVDIKVSTGNVESSASVLNDIKIKTTTGKIELANLSAKNVDLTVSTGKIEIENITVTEDIKIKVSTGESELENVTCRNLTSNGSTGDLNLENVVGSGIFNIERDTGDVEFENCDANELIIVTDTGDVTGNLLTEKIFLIDTDTGRKIVPESLSGGRCKITTDTGDVIISIGRE